MGSFHSVPLASKAMRDPDQATAIANFMTDYETFAEEIVEYRDLLKELEIAFGNASSQSLKDEYLGLFRRVELNNTTNVLSCRVILDENSWKVLKRSSKFEAYKKEWADLEVLKSAISTALSEAEQILDQVKDRTTSKNNARDLQTSESQSSILASPHDRREHLSEKPADTERDADAEDLVENRTIHSTDDTEEEDFQVRPDDGAKDNGKLKRDLELLREEFQQFRMANADMRPVESRDEVKALGEKFEKLKLEVAGLRADNRELKMRVGGQTITNEELEEEITSLKANMHELRSKCLA